jgi:hypothetical protein
MSNNQIEKIKQEGVAEATFIRTGWLPASTDNPEYHEKS